jgi:TRAP transporter TAXI family solute receptor
MEVKMKNRLSSLVYGLFVLVLLTSSIAANAATSETWPREFSIATTDPGSMPYMIGAYWVKLLGGEHGMTPTVVVKPGMAKVVDLNKGLLDVAIISSFDILQQLGGLGQYATVGPQNKMRFVCLASINPFHIAVRTNSSVNSVKDFKGKVVSGIGDVRVPTNPAGNKLIIEAYGLSPSDLAAPIQANSTSDYQRLFREGGVEVYSQCHEVGQPGLVELTRSIPTRFISLDDKEINYIVQKSGGWLMPANIPAGSYTGQDKELKSIGFSFSFYANPQVPDNVVYEMFKYAADPKYIGGFRALHASLSKYALQNAIASPTAPYHNGVVRYLKENGLWTKELEQKQTSLLQLFK